MRETPRQRLVRHSLCFLFGLLFVRLLVWISEALSFYFEQRGGMP